MFHSSYVFPHGFYSSFYEVRSMWTQCHVWSVAVGTKLSTWLKDVFSSQCVCAKSLQSCPTLCDPRDCSPPGSSVHGIFQARTLEEVAMPFSRGSSNPGIKPASYASLLAGGFFITSDFLLRSVAKWKIEVQSFFS